MNKTINVAIAGGAGFTGGELIRLLLNHPDVKITAVLSDSQNGKPIASVHRDLTGETDLIFSKDLPPTGTDVLFLCLGHGRSAEFLQTHTTQNISHIIDLSRDFRFVPKSPCGRLFHYGLPESYKDPETYAASIRKAGNIANPGCFATAIELALLPLAAAGLLRKDIHIHAITGATGAGALPSDTTHYAWRSNNVSVYKVFNHQHVPEVEALLSSVAGNRLPSLFFVPMRGGFSRGIFAGVYTECPLTQEEATELYLEYYSRHPFVSVAKESISLKEVVNTNKCKLYMEKHGNMLYTTSILDNLLKGASGTAVQNMNLLAGLPQTTGLNLKATAF